MKRKRKPDPKAYARLQNRLAKNYRDAKKRRWGIFDLKEFIHARAAGFTHTEVAKKFGRSLASVQAVQRKIAHLKKLNLPLGKYGMISEKKLYHMAKEAE